MFIIWILLYDAKNSWFIYKSYKFVLNNVKLVFMILNTIYWVLVIL